ncbi:hypothetical protein LCGC14_0415610 [marine sediment metagenome]|uniref:Uncharacterized protein n=1 Tax=marine sediment metagenome TaxID=412755 RepID=A0A0F9SSF6_9ZZZZ
MPDKKPPRVPPKRKKPDKPENKPENSRKGEITGKLLTTELKRLAHLAHSVDDEGNPLTKQQVLAAMVWDKALGYTKVDKDTNKKVEYKPERWAISMLFDRLEGRVNTADKDNKERPLSEKMSDAAKKRIESATSDAE